MAIPDNYLQPISEGAPSGEDLLWDPIMNELKNSVRGKVDRRTEETSRGKKVVEIIEEPNWHKAMAVCDTVLSRSKELSAQVIYATGRLQMDGLEGMADGIELISHTVQNYWDSLHPILEPEDHNDPTPRFGLIENLSLAGMTIEDDPLRFIERLRQTPLFRDPVIGTINLLSLQDARPKSDAESARIVRDALAQARQTPAVAEIEKGKAAVARALAAIQAMNRFLTADAATSDLPSLERLVTQLELIMEIYQAGGAAESEAPIAEPTPEAGTESAAPAQAVGTASAARPVVVGEIHSSADVIRALDKICEYYRKSEPSSPVPLLLVRARRLVGQSFMEVLNDLASSAVDQVKVIAGQAPENPNK